MNDTNPLHQLTEICQLKDMYNKYGPLPCNFCDNQALKFLVIRVNQKLSVE